MTGRRWRTGFRLGLLFLLLFIAALATSQFWIAWFLYRPAALTDPDPKAWGLPGAVSMQVRYGDGTVLTGWWAPPARPDNPVVLVLHGRSANIATRAPIMKRLAADGFGVLMVDYRGYGASSGTPSEAHLTQDSRTAYHWLREEGVPAGKIAVLGQSLGNGPASALAAQEQVGALVLVAPFTSLPEALGDRLPWLPIQLVPWQRNRFDVSGNLGRFRGPLLLIASTADGLVPVRTMERVRRLRPDARWLDASPLRHDGMLLAVAQDGRLTQEVRRLGSKDSRRH